MSSPSERAAQEQMRQINSTIRRIFDWSRKKLKFKLKKTLRERYDLYPDKKIKQALPTQARKPQKTVKAPRKQSLKAKKVVKQAPKQVVEGTKIAASIGADLAGDVAGLASGGTGKLVQEGAKVATKVAQTSVKAAQIADKAIDVVDFGIDAAEYAGSYVMSMTMEMD